MNTIIILLIVTITIVMQLHVKRWIKHGHFAGRKFFRKREHDYYIEEVVFDDYQEALHNYFKIVNDVASQGEILEQKYDLYDWTYSIFRFKNTTIELRHIRPLNKVRMIKSKVPISIEEYEKDNPSFEVI